MIVILNWLTDFRKQKNYTLRLISSATYLMLLSLNSGYIGSDYLVTLAYVQAQKSNPEGVCAAADSYGVIALAEVGEVFFEFCIRNRSRIIGLIAYEYEFILQKLESDLNGSGGKGLCPPA